VNDRSEKVVIENLNTNKHALKLNILFGKNVL